MQLLRNTYLTYMCVKWDQFNRGTRAGWTGQADGCIGRTTGCAGGAGSCAGGAGVLVVVLGLQGMVVVLVVLHQPFLFMSWVGMLYKPGKRLSYAIYKAKL